MDRNLVSCIDRAVNIIVALRKESVDRNIDGIRSTGVLVSRSPQGERG